MRRRSWRKKRTNPDDVCFQSLEEKEELELFSTRLKGDVRMYRQRNKQTLRQLEEVIRERDKVRRSRRRIWRRRRKMMMRIDLWCVRLYLRGRSSSRRCGCSCRRRTTTGSRSERSLNNPINWSSSC